MFYLQRASALRVRGVGKGKVPQLPPGKGLEQTPERPGQAHGDGGDEEQPVWIYQG